MTSKRSPAACSKFCDPMRISHELVSSFWFLVSGSGRLSLASVKEGHKKTGHNEPETTNQKLETRNRLRGRRFRRPIDMKTLLIPFKDPSRAKTRLAKLLSEDERRRLALAMFDDVTEAVEAANQADRIFLISSFAPAVQRARDLGWDLLIEESQVSESASVDWACDVLSERGFKTAMRLPADVPLVRAEDIDELLSIRLETPGTVLVPSREGSGTNAIIRTPPNLFPSRFGPNSLALHKQEAARVGVECVIVKNARIALDIDEPGDVEQLLEAGRGTRAFALLCEINIFDRLRP